MSLKPIQTHDAVYCTKARRTLSSIRRSMGGAVGIEILLPPYGQEILELMPGP